MNNVVKEQVDKIKRFVDSLEFQIKNAITEKNYLIKQVNSVQDKIADLRKELKDWQETLERIEKIDLD